jgi:hypothetical protein
MICAGQFSQLPSSALRTEETASGLWGVGVSLYPTPCTGDWHRTKYRMESLRNNWIRGHQTAIQDYLRGSGVPIRFVPNAYEWAMGIPEDWTSV